MTAMQMSEPSGLLVLNKPVGITSHDCIYKIRKAYSTKRVGHTGTLDPLASGVLLVLVGRAAKAAEYLSADIKSYTATLRLGITTDTEDITGKVLSECDNIPAPERVISVCGEFVGEIMQIPPMYSALKVGGQKLYELARQGIVVDREPRSITVHSLDVAPAEFLDRYILNVTCSAGTYIRTLCADIGKELGCGGVMETLVRTSVADFRIENSHSLEEIAEMSQEEKLSLLLPTYKLFENLPEICLPAFYERLCRNGCEIYEKKIKTHFPVGTRVRLCNETGEFFALGEVFEYPEGNAVKAIKMF